MLRLLTVVLVVTIGAGGCYTSLRPSVASVPANPDGRPGTVWLEPTYSRTVSDKWGKDSDPLKDTNESMWQGGLSVGVVANRSMTLFAGMSRRSYNQVWTDATTWSTDFKARQETYFLSMSARIYLNK